MLEWEIRNPEFYISYEYMIKPWGLCLWNTEIVYCKKKVLEFESVLFDSDFSKGILNCLPTNHRGEISDVLNFNE